MNNMLKFELKKIFSKPVNKIMLILLLVIVLVGSFLAIRDVKYVTEDGRDVYSGISAAHQLKSEKGKWEGAVTEDVLKNVVNENQLINASGDVESDMNFSKKQGIYDLTLMLSRAFSYPGEFDYYMADSLSPEKAATLYDQRIPALKTYLNSGKEGEFSPEEKSYLVSRYEKFEAPLNYSYMEGWKALMNSGAGYLNTLIIITVVIMGFLVAGIFSDEFQLKADSIFFSTKLGRNKAVRAKIMAGFLTITIIYWSVMLLFSGLILGTLGFSGADCMIQIEEWWSMYNITWLQEWLIVMSGGYIGGLFILTLAMLISAKCHSTVVAITIPFALSCAPMFLGRVSILTQIMNLFPDMLLRFNVYISDFILYNIGGNVTGVYGILFPLYIILFIMLIPTLYQVYKRAEVK